MFNVNLSAPLQWEGCIATRRVYRNEKGVSQWEGCIATRRVYRNEKGVSQWEGCIATRRVYRNEKGVSQWERCITMRRVYRNEKGVSQWEGCIAQLEAEYQRASKEDPHTPLMSSETESFNVKQQLLQRFSCSALPSVLTSGLSSWGGDISRRDEEAIDKIIRQAGGLWGGHKAI